MKTNPDNSKEKSAVWQALSYAWQFGYTVAVPLVILALLGRFLDRRLDTSPWLLLAGILLSMVISTTALVIRALKIMKNVSQKSISQSSKDDKKHPDAR
ncbi:MAG: AtpZ/AtpI family protein [Candidatus Kerfeldbacteria bacterium]|nr:AtpZ/AtpI family protein [Candidatus Kerfeldbacteria bacterium]